MSGESVREALGDFLEPLLPAGWQLLRYQATITTLDRPVVIFKHNKIRPLPESPMGTLENEFIVTIASPKTDMATAEAELDEAVIELITALDAHPRLLWTEAEKVSVKSPYIGWDITLTVQTQKETPA